MNKLYLEGKVRDYLKQFTKSHEYIANFSIRSQDASREHRIVIRSLSEVSGKSVLKKASSNLALISKLSA